MNVTLLSSTEMLVPEHTHLLIAGDGVYAVTRMCDFTFPVPLLTCEIRGLVPLLSGTAAGESTLFPPLPFAPSHHVLLEGTPRPEHDPSRIFQYIIAREGVFVLASNASIEVLLPISVYGQLPGFASVSPYVTWKFPRVGAAIVTELFERARAGRVEKLMYLTYGDAEDWSVHEPEQSASAVKVAALSTSDADETAPIEVHSHPGKAFFSSTDDEDELVHGGFKVYCVLGGVQDGHPHILARVCVHGYAWMVAAHFFFELPHGVEDALAQKGGA